MGVGSGPSLMRVFPSVLPTPFSWSGATDYPAPRGMSKLSPPIGRFGQPHRPRFPGGGLPSLCAQAARARELRFSCSGLDSCPRIARFPVQDPSIFVKSMFIDHSYKGSYKGFPSFLPRFFRLLLAGFHTSTRPHPASIHLRFPLVAPSLFLFHLVRFPLTSKTETLYPSHVQGFPPIVPPLAVRGDRPQSGRF